MQHCSVRVRRCSVRVRRSSGPGFGAARRHAVRGRPGFDSHPACAPSVQQADYYDPDEEDFQSQEKCNSVRTSLINSDFQSVVPLKNLF